MSVYYTDYGIGEMAEHSASHGGTFSFAAVRGFDKMKCPQCGMIIVEMDGTVRTRNSVQSVWAVEHFLVIEWP